MATLAYHIFKKQVSYDGGETWQDAVPLETVKMPVTGVTCEIPWTSRMIYKRYQDKCVDPCYAGEATGCTQIHSGCDLTYDVTEYYVNLSKGSTLSSGDTGVIINDGDINNDSSTIASENCTLVINSGLTTIDDEAFPWNRVIPTSLGGRIDTIDFTNATDLTKIGKKAFWYKLNRDMSYDNPLIRELTFPNSLAIIDDEAFEGSTLEHIYFGANSSINTIGDEAFKTIPGITVHFSGATPPSNVSDYAFGNYPKFVIIVPDQYLSTYRNVMSGISSNIISDTHLVNAGKCQHGSWQDAGSTGNTITTIPCDSTSALTSADVNTLCSWIKIGDCVETIGNGFMYNTYQDVYDINDKHLLYLDLGSSVKYIGDEAFKNQQRLEKITFPNSLRTIGASAFTSCEMLTDISIPSGVTNIGDYAFSNCTNLKNITVGGGDIGTGAFSFSDSNNSSSYDSINILEGVTTIGEDAFSNVGLNMTDLTIPDSVTTIGEGAFTPYGRCCLVTGVTIGSGITYIESDLPGTMMIKGTSNLKTVYGDFSPYNNETVFELPNVEELGCTLGTGFTGIHIGTKIKTISSISGNLTGITIDCTSPESIDVYWGALDGSSCPIYVPCDSFLDYKTSSMWARYRTRIMPKQECPPITLKLYGVNRSGNTYSIVCNGDSTLTINETQYTAPVTAEIGNCVTKIGNEAFYLGQDLTSVTFSNTITEIGASAFTSCNSIETFDLPSGTTKIGNYAFAKCTSLTGITIPSGVTSMGDGMFSNCTSLVNAEIPEPVDGISSLMFAGCTSLENVILPNTLGYIFSSAFAGCTGLTNITIPSGVIFIGDYAFERCTHLTGITIPSGVTEIKSYVFQNCVNLESISIPNGVTIIKNNSFQYCRSLVSIVVPNSVTEIQSYAFNGCSSLTSITVLATTPPSLSRYDVFSSTNNCPIYVPSSSVNTYKTATNWSNYASRIQAIS